MLLLFSLLNYLIQSAVAHPVLSSFLFIIAGFCYVYAKKIKEFGGWYNEITFSSVKTHLLLGCSTLLVWRFSSIMDQPFVEYVGLLMLGMFILSCGSILAFKSLDYRFSLAEEANRFERYETQKKQNDQVKQKTQSKPDVHTEGCIVPCSKIHGSSCTDTPPIIQDELAGLYENDKCFEGGKPKKKVEYITQRELNARRLYDELGFDQPLFMVSFFLMCMADTDEHFTMQLVSFSLLLIATTIRLWKRTYLPPKLLLGWEIRQPVNYLRLAFGLAAIAGGLTGLGSESVNGFYLTNMSCYWLLLTGATECLFAFYYIPVKNQYTDEYEDLYIVDVPPEFRKGNFNKVRDEQLDKYWQKIDAKKKDRTKKDCREKGQDGE